MFSQKNHYWQIFEFTNDKKNVSCCDHEAKSTKGWSSLRENCKLVHAAFLPVGKARVRRG